MYLGVGLRDVRAVLPEARNLVSGLGFSDEDSGFGVEGFRIWSLGLRGWGDARSWASTFAEVAPRRMSAAAPGRATSIVY